VNTIPGNHEVEELQKTTIQGTAHILQKLLMLKYIRAKAGASDMGTINSSDRIAATMYCLWELFVSGICVKIPCIKDTLLLLIIIILLLKVEIIV
jgi:hypothetical protein